APARIIRNEVDDQLDPVLVQRITQSIEVRHRTVVSVGDEVVVSMVAVKTGPAVDASARLVVLNHRIPIEIRRRDPDSGDAHILQVRDLLGDSFPVTSLIELEVVPGAI